MKQLRCIFSFNYFNKIDIFLVFKIDTILLMTQMSATLCVSGWIYGKNQHLRINIPHTASINTWKAAVSSGSLCHLLAFSTKLWEHLLGSTAALVLHLRSHFLLQLWWTWTCDWCWSTLLEMWQAEGSQPHLSRWSATLSDTAQYCIRDAVALKKSLICPLKVGA